MNQITQVLEVFNSFRLPATAIDKYESTGKQLLAEKLSPYISNNQPIEFVMLGYPMKSPNARDKVLGVLPDMGEAASFDNFLRFSNAIRQFYTPGINLNIVSDGYVFNDIVGVNEKIVAAYGEVAADMASIAPTNWYTLNDFYSRKSSLAHNRQKLMDHFGISEQELEHRLLFDADVNALYRGMIRFMEQDLAIHEYDSNNQLHKAAKKAAREMMLRNEAYSQLVSYEFKDCIRLSMHQSENVKKFGFQLIPGANAYHSPWHASVVSTGSELITMHKSDAINAGYKLVYKNGQPYNFVTQ